MDDQESYSTNEQRTEDEEIIDLAINIFQNVGIKRWIDQLEILKNQQIYFEICKIIFPETIIHLFRLTENKEMTTGQKIQGVIDLIAKLIKNDLYHIRGESIAEGVHSHLKNFLQLLQALSSQIMLPKQQIEVESAPENNRSLTYDDHHNYYTVIGMDKEFQDVNYLDQNQEKEEEEQQQPPQRPAQPSQPKQQQQAQKQAQQQPVSQRPPQQQPESSEEQQEFPIRPKNKKDVKDKSNRKTKDQDFKQKISASRRKTPTYTPPPQISKEIRPYPVPLHEQNTHSFQIQNRKWVNLVSKMHETTQNLEKQRQNDMKIKFSQWLQTHAFNCQQKEEEIQQQIGKRKKFINKRINSREEILKSLKGEEQAAKAIRDLFKQEKKVKMEQREKARQIERANHQKLMNFRELDELLQRAIVSGKSQQE